MINTDLETVISNFELFAKNFLVIKPKSGQSCKFTFNYAQRYVNQVVNLQLKNTGKVRCIILKGRQMGLSTWIEARFFWKVITTPGLHAYILTHEAEATSNLFAMALRFYANLPDGLCPEAQTSTAKKLYFKEFDSGYSVGTAGNKGAGRSQTIQLFHGSESAFWPHAEEHQKGVLEAVANVPGTEIFIESTANGIGNTFHDLWTQAETGRSEYKPIFIPWYWDPTYTANIDGFILDEEEKELLHNHKSKGLKIEHIAWRRIKINRSKDRKSAMLRFKQEYPCIVGSQRVGTSRGLIPINQLILADKTHSGLIKKQWSSGIKPTIKITTKLGYSLECTLDHRIALAEGGFIEAKDSLNKVIKLSIPKLSNELQVVSWQHLPCLESRSTISEDFALFLGFYMGNGSFYHHTLSVAFNKRDTASIDVVRRLFKTLFGKEPEERISSANGRELRACIKAAKKLFDVLGVTGCDMDGRRKRKVCVPESIFRSPPHIIKEFLRGLFDADGFAGTTPVIKFFSKHTKFASDVQLLLLSFGITCRRITVKKEAPNGKTYWGDEVTLRKAEATLFKEKIGFVSQTKIDRMNAWRTEKQASGMHALKISFNEEVRSIKELGDQEVFDLEMVSEPHVFDASGILVHNCNAQEAFLNPVGDTFINSDIVYRAMQNSIGNIPGRIIIGVDPAIGDNDRSAIIRRVGRKAYGLETFYNHNTMETAGRIKKIIDKEKPFKVFIDCIGVGAGVTDRLLEMGYQNIVVGVNVARSASDPEYFKNLRAELWSEMRDWFSQSMDVEIPDSDELHADLCSCGYKYPGGQLLIESKEQMRKRGLRSSDAADSLMLTFADGYYSDNTGTDITYMRPPKAPKADNLFS